MIHYWKKCPHCRRTIENGRGGPTSSFGNPHKICKFCGKPYRDRNIINWETASAFRKFLYYFANGRIAICFFPSLIFAFFASERGWQQPILYGLLVFLLLFALCVLYVEILAKSYYGTGPDTKWFRVLANICEFLSKNLGGILGILLIVFIILTLIYVN